MRHRAIYTKELAERICQEIATSKVGIETICKQNKDFPCFKTIFNWISRNENFENMYLKAKRSQTHLLMDSLLDIISPENPENDDLIKINRDRLKIDVIKHTSARLNLTHYGDKKEVNNNIKIDEVTEKAKGNMKGYDKDE